MNRRSALRHEFVEYVPDIVGEGVVYVSTRFLTAMHICCCGCGSEIVTPISPADWQLTFDGQTVSLNPSIGNWSLPCRSHYWIRRNSVVWAATWTESEIAEGRELDRVATEERFATTALEQRDDVATKGQPDRPRRDQSLWQRILRALE